MLGTGMGASRDSRFEPSPQCKFQKNMSMAESNTAKCASKSKEYLVLFYHFDSHGYVVCLI